MQTDMQAKTPILEYIERVDRRPDRYTDRKRSGDKSKSSWTNGRIEEFTGSQKQRSRKPMYRLRGNGNRLQSIETDIYRKTDRLSQKDCETDGRNMRKS